MQNIILSVLSLIFTVLTTVASAEDLLLVSDVSRKPRVPEGYQSCTFGSTKIFFADDGVHGYEPWIGDTLIGSSHLLKDINPGPGSSYSNGCATVGNILYFTARDPSFGQELWRTDGTEAGTTMVKDVNPGTGDANIYNLQAVGNKVVFSAAEPVNGSELWVSDGTTAGTQILADFNTGSSSSSPYLLTALGSKIVTSCETPATGRELCVADVNAPGAAPVVVNIAPGASASGPSDFRVYNNIILFQASTPATGTELFRTDGTIVGTTLVKDIIPGGTGGVVGSISPFVFQNKVYFAGTTPAEGKELWASDGTAAGTTLFKDINPGAADSLPDGFISVNGKLLFIATNTANGREYFVSDGTSPGTTVLTDLTPGPTSSFDTYNVNHQLGVNNTRLFFTPPFSPEGSELYSTDGTAAGTQRVSNIIPGNIEGGAYAFFDTGAKTLFTAPPVAPSLPSSTLFFSDGTPAGSGVHPGTMASYTSSSNPIIFGQLGSKLIFAADDGDSGYELWSTDGTDAGTTRIADLQAGTTWSVAPQYGSVVVGLNMLFVGMTPGQGAELWKTDGTAAGTVLLKDIEPGTASSFDFSTNYGTTFYSMGTAPGSVAVFAAQTATNGLELWKTDGTGAGTTLLTDIFPGASSGLSEQFFHAGLVAATPTTNYLYFAASDATHGRELWVTNGIVTILTGDLNPGAPGSNPLNISPYPPLPGTALFSAYTPAVGDEFFVSNGGSAPFLLKDIATGVASSDPEGFTTILDPSAHIKIIYSAYSASTGRELRAYDATSSTEALLKEIVPGGIGSSISEITALNGTTAIFKACSGSSGYQDCELWKTDGTTAGTVLVKDIYPGLQSSDPTNITTLGSTAYFYAAESGSGYSTMKIFSSNGTAAGTYSLTPQSETDFSGGLITLPIKRALGTLFMSLKSKAYGLELFKIGSDACPSDPSKSFPGLCGCGVADDDSDGDGVVNCADQCSSNSGKSAPGICGCGTPDIDASGNGVIDCIDLTISSVRPPKPKLKLLGAKSKNPKVQATFTARVGTKILMYSRVTLIKKQKGKKTPKFKAKLINTLTYKFAKPKRGYKLELKYRYRNSDVGARESVDSPAATYKVK